MNDTQILTDTLKFHGHRCWASVAGVRVGLAALRALDVKRSGGTQLYAIIETGQEHGGMCFGDGVQYTTGCTFGKGNLIYHPLGKMAFTFYFRESGESLRVYFKGENDKNLDRAAYMDYLLNAPVEELFAFSQPAAPCPEHARRFASVTCTACGEKAREDKIRLKDGKPYCLACFDEYDR